ncbi:MAG: type II toxin-antitoxin system PemK/MazF family toxin [Mycobacteriales bacterium]
MPRSKNSQLAPWQVWWADFTAPAGREQAGRRPAIVVGSALACSLPNGLAVVVPCTGVDRGLPYQPAVRLSGRTSFAMCDQIRALRRDRLVQRHQATLTTEDIEEIRFALAQIIQVR